MEFSPPFWYSPGKKTSGSTLPRLEWRQVNCPVLGWRSLDFFKGEWLGGDSRGPKPRSPRGRQIMGKCYKNDVVKIPVMASKHKLSRTELLDRTAQCASNPLEFPKFRTSWWLNQPILRICVKLDHFPRVPGENKKDWNHHLENFATKKVFTNHQIALGRFTKRTKNLLIKVRATLRCSRLWQSTH